MRAGPLNVIVQHDAAEGVWFVDESDIPGLAAEAPTYDALVEVVLDVAADLVAGNMPDFVVPKSGLPLVISQRITASPAAA